jgi:hypothetical protein
MDYLNPGITDEYHLGLFPQRENCCMPQTILGFKKILVEYIIMWNMTIITVYSFPV